LCNLLILRGGKHVWKNLYESLLWLVFMRIHQKVQISKILWNNWKKIIDYRIYCTTPLRPTVYSGVRTTCKLCKLQGHEYVITPDVPNYNSCAQDAAKILEYLVDMPSNGDTIYAKNLKTAPSTRTELQKLDMDWNWTQDHWHALPLRLL